MVTNMIAHLKYYLFCQSNGIAVIAAGFSTLATAIGYPFDNLKALVQVGSSSGKQLTGADVVNKVLCYSGSLAAAASHGFDTAKSRSQCMVLPKFFMCSMYPWRGFLKWKLPGKRFESWTGIHPTDRNILFRGLGLRMARSGIASFVVVGGYLFAIDKVLSE
ncbi:hypothetical protein P3S67_026442 [Capsicum chacoense]